MDLNELTQGKEITSEIIKKVFAKVGEEYRYYDEHSDITIKEAANGKWDVNIENYQSYAYCRITTTNQLQAFLTIAGRRDIAEKIL